MITAETVEHASQGFGTTRVFREGDHSVTATIFSHPVYMSFKSEQTGEPVYEDVNMISIKATGQSHSVPSRKLTEEDKERFPELWEAFENGIASATEGTPIESWDRIPKARATELRALGIPTLEAMAGITDANLSGIGMDGTKLREAAKKDLEALQDNNHEIEGLKEEIESLKAENQKLMAQLKTPKKRGRPPKNDPSDNSTKRA